jgi:hypothetical protein
MHRIMLNSWLNLRNSNLYTPAITGTLGSGSRCGPVVTSARLSFTLFSLILIIDGVDALHILMWLDVP